jgi:tetratricopeptide (TPR) repeat protein
VDADPTAVATLIREILTERGPLSEEDLVEALISADAPMGDDPEAFFDRIILWDDLGPVAILTDGRYCWLPAVLRGRIFTHRIDEHEVERDLLTITPDLEHLTLLTDGPDAFGLDGTPLPIIFRELDELPEGREIPLEAIAEQGSFLLPGGTLAQLGAQPGDLIALGVADDHLTIERATDVGGPPETLASSLLSLLDEEDFETIDLVIPSLCADNDELFRSPLEPIGDLLDSMGFARRGDNVAVPGFDFDAALLARRILSLQERQSLDEDTATAVAQLIGLFHDVEELAEHLGDGDEPTPAAADQPDAAGQAEEIDAIHDITRYLSDPEVANVFLDETLYVEQGDPASLAALAGGLELQAPREARAPLRWLQGKAYEYIGDVEAAEKTLDEAEGLDPDWPLTLLDLARYASDRGDATRALSLLRRADIGEDSRFVTALRQYQPRSRPDMRRNAPCWCGSGRKYKACHLNNEQLSLAERAGWLYEKAQEHLRTGRWPGLLIGYAEFRMKDDTEDELIGAVFDPLVRDVLLAEGGAFLDFLLRRGSLLPADERELAEQWVATRRSVYEIVGVLPGEEVTLQDVVSNERHELAEQETHDMRTGALVCGRLLPVENTLRSFGGLEPVSRDDLDDVLDALREGDCADVIEALSR